MAAIRIRAALFLAGSLLVAACASPPEREMQQARTGVEEARAAGAEQYAPDEYRDATAALRRSEEAVAQHDYRSALSFALDSRERATDAVKTAADQKARARNEVERALVDIQALQAQLRDRIKAADATRIPRPQQGAVSDARRSIVVVNVAVQEAGEALNREDYVGARQAIRDAADNLKAAIVEVDAAIAAAQPRRRR
jgi:hypothetical protein